MNLSPRWWVLYNGNWVWFTDDLRRGSYNPRGTGLYFWREWNVKLCHTNYICICGPGAYIFASSSPKHTESHVRCDYPQQQSAPPLQISLSTTLSLWPSPLLSATIVIFIISAVFIVIHTPARPWASCIGDREHRASRHWGFCMLATRDHHHHSDGGVVIFMMVQERKTMLLAQGTWKSIIFYHLFSLLHLCSLYLIYLSFSRNSHSDVFFFSSLWYTNFRSTCEKYWEWDLSLISCFPTCLRLSRQLIINNKQQWIKRVLRHWDLHFKVIFHFCLTRGIWAFYVIIT